MTINPTMVSMVREVRGMTQAQLAERIGVSQPFIVQIEGGIRPVSAERVETLATSLDCPIALLEQTEPFIGGEAADLHFRKRKTLPARDRRVLEYKLHLGYLTVRGLLRGVDFDPSLPLPELPVDEPGDAANAARILRRLWRIPAGPIASVTKYLEGAGVFQIPCDTSGKVDAVTRRGENGWHVLAYNRAMPDNRLRHTRSHELGHLVLHRFAAYDAVEDEANEFAAEFLMPADEIQGSLVGLSSRDMGRVIDLAQGWGVSPKSIVYRADALGLVTERQRRSLYIALNQVNQDFAIAEEKPQLLDLIVQLHTGQLRESEILVAEAALMTKSRFRHRFGGGSRLHVV